MQVVKPVGGAATTNLDTSPASRHDAAMQNAEQIDYWNGKAGETWVAMQDRMDRALSPVTAALLTAAAPALGEEVLDIGCGAGETSLAFAVAVGEDGFVTGVDISAPLLARARERAQGVELDIEFVEADAATFDEGDRDLIVSRFGVMFFDDPVAAFTNIHGLAVPGGRLAFACWQPPSANRWATLPMELLADLAPVETSADPHAPGPFAFADKDRTGAILTDAGWRDIAFAPVDFAMAMGDGDDPIASAVGFALKIGPAARAIREAGPDAVAIARTRLSAAFAEHVADGAVALPAAVWIVTAIA